MAAAGGETGWGKPLPRRRRRTGQGSARPRRPRGSAGRGHPRAVRGPSRMWARCSGTPRVRVPGRPRDALPAPAAGAARCRRSRAQHQGQIPVSAGGARGAPGGARGIRRGHGRSQYARADPGFPGPRAAPSHARVVPVSPAAEFLSVSMCRGRDGLKPGWIEAGMGDARAPHASSSTAGTMQPPGDGPCSGLTSASLQKHLEQVSLGPAASMAKHPLPCWERLA